MVELATLAELYTHYLWVFLRISALWMALPVFGSGVLSTRLRLVLGVSCTILIGSMLPEVIPPPLWSAAWWLAIVQEIALGVLMAFTLALVFEMIRLAAEVIGMAMGLGFAQMTDPLNGLSAPVLGQYFSILAILLFLAGGGHLAVVQWLAMSLIDLPPGRWVMDSGQVMIPVVWASNVFAGALQVALPALVALLLMNLSFGVISRAAPSLNLFAIGFPASLILGLVMVMVTLPLLQTHFTRGIEAAFEQIALFGG